MIDTTPPVTRPVAAAAAAPRRGAAALRADPGRQAAGEEEIQRPQMEELVVWAQDELR